MKTSHKIREGSIAYWTIKILELLAIPFWFASTYSFLWLLQ